MVSRKPKKKKKQRRRSKESNTSSLGDHRRKGKTLLPPMLSMVPDGKLQLASWTSDRLPEMLWACLVSAVLPREYALDVFREVASLGLRYRDSSGLPGWNLFHSSLPRLPDEFISEIVRIVAKHPLGYAALRPLLLFDALPGRALWVSAIGTEPQEGDWDTLGDAVRNTLDHQSEESTDVRWLSLLFLICLGRMHFDQSSSERVREIVYYPNLGDMRSVRPFIRSSELSLGELNVESEKGEVSTWATDFWGECLHKTKCMRWHPERELGRNHDAKRMVSDLRQLQAELTHHWGQTLGTSGVDPRHDAAFGFGFYGIAALLEMSIGNLGRGIAGRVLLRVLVECRITLAYLCAKNDPDLWARHRSFGTGQAKLAFLKIDESPEAPGFVSADVLERLANEDFFEEFVPIELGHWCGIDLRKMAEESETKDDYDLLYGWPSAFVHGNWPALRDACMTHCGNPLHRLHRVPLVGHRKLENAVWDGIRMLSAILDSLSDLYPTFESRVTGEAEESPGER